ncbi:MAG: hypothetical protein ACE366_20305 [Bradymonadia bacterium]
MKIIPRDRRFQVGAGDAIVQLTHTHDVHPEPDEQVTFHAGEAEYDVVRKSWGFYATPSVNGRLKRFGLRTALVENPAGLRYVLLVDRTQMADFEAYLRDQCMTVLTWLDDPDDEPDPR